ncbi:hypothetical protein PoB_004220200 [Plakobranchus ocellatus]|uniref:Uncharacterized protein n=1 Tax=Plakobranchus ocellatus TaxID=259542 RepID=A0AAV4B877_9GAST|nr:hypothetical protein PoB_004220200 [Plakobranchus ocellatus]
MGFNVLQTTTAVTCFRSGNGTAIWQGKQSRISTEQALSTRVVSQTDLKCPIVCCPGGECCETEREETQHPHLTVPAYVFVVLLFGGFTVFLLFKLITSCRSCRSFATSTRNPSPTQSSRAFEAPQKKPSGDKPPPYPGLTDTHVIGRVSADNCSPLAPAAATTVHTSSASLPAYSDIFKGGDEELASVAVVNVSGHVEFKTYAEIFPSHHK